MRILYHHRTQAEDGQAVHIRALIAAFRALGHEVEEVALVARTEATAASSAPQPARSRYGWVAHAGRVAEGVALVQEVRAESARGPQEAPAGEVSVAVLGQLALRLGRARAALRARAGRVRLRAGRAHAAPGGGARAIQP